MSLQLLKYILPVSFLVIRNLHAMASEMKYVHYEKGGAENLSVQTTNIPALREREVLVKVFATAVNRADTIQRKGFYPPPPGESEILGLEAAGTIEKIGSDCTGSWKVGDKVMALLTGGGYAEFVALPEDMLLMVPNTMKFSTAAGIPEVWLTAYQLLHIAGELEKGDTVLIHAGGSGVGTAAVQLCVLAGCKPIVTAGSESKLQMAKELGAVAGFNYKEGDWSEKVLEFTQGRGVDLILDCIGASYYEQNMKSVRTEGRWVLYGLLGGGTISGDVFSQMLRKRIRITGTTLRARKLQYKKNVTDGFTRDCLPLFKDGSRPALKPVIDTIFPFNKAADAHRYMEANKNTGKIILQIRDEISGQTIHDEL
ncbi:quinone oxidoreductase PIG3-like [Mercenaria mercenaria]|uniref:quinone oxidoreductase PIG3-like n=1 Tax=Mercenaria mercenaria TaxID=6596 RepID=UPI00234EBF30|nr:quinone oxidoreductase PIG3-like [Mercenaria mercenaria]